MNSMRFTWLTAVVTALFVSLSSPSSAQDVAALEKASRKGDAAASLELAQLMFDRYDYDAASDYLSTYRSQVARNRKKLTDLSGDLDERISLMETMMAAVEDVVVFDSIVVDKDRFFARYALSPGAGRLLDAQQLPGGFAAASPTAAFMPQSCRNVIWGAPVTHPGDSVPTTELRMSWQLYGGEWESPVSLGENLNCGADANWPFMAADGVTLYYASNGEGSLGGYDIFKTQRTDDGYFDPVNIGMPYNSPYDDYLLAIDENLGVGWWATDRNRIPGKVTIYMFVPARVRINLADDDSEQLAARARLSSIRDTWRQGEDYSALRRAVAQSSEADEAVSADYVCDLSGALTLPDGTVCTGADDLRSQAARSAWSEYAQLRGDYEAALDQLARMREAYAKGDRSTAVRLRQEEGRTEALRKRLTEVGNRVIRALGR